MYEVIQFENPDKLDFGSPAKDVIFWDFPNHTQFEEFLVD